MKIKGIKRGYLPAFSGLFVWGFVLLLGCGSARRGVPVAGPIQLTEQEKVGRTVFVRICNQCHPGGEAGVGPALNNKPLPGFMIKMQVRRGLGAMPAFPEDKISEEELDDLVGYLKTIRTQG
jgi:mono/diheme cytochrome c family protein